MDLSTLSSYTFGSYWLSVNREGKLQAIRKEYALLRLFKTILGNVLHRDFYSHIRLHTVLACIEKQAIQEKVSEAVSCYLRILSNLKQALPVKKGEGLVKVADTIQSAHPEMRLSLDRIQQLYVGRATPLQTSAESGSNEPEDSNGNRYVDYHVHLSIRARIPVSNIRDGSFSKVEIFIPAWKILTRDPSAPITGNSVCYLSNDDVRSSKVSSVDVLIEDQEAKASSNGIVRFPNGRILDINRTYYKTFNTTFSKGPYNLQLIADFTTAKK